MSESASSCSHCGNQPAKLQQCSRCKQVAYCGADCQNADWKKHKKKCVSIQEVLDTVKRHGPPTKETVCQKVLEADSCGDWREVLKWEGRMEELLGTREHPGPRGLALRENIVRSFMNAHAQKNAFEGREREVEDVVRLEKRRIEILGSMEQFRDQGEGLGFGVYGFYLGKGDLFCS